MSSDNCQVRDASESFSEVLETVYIVHISFEVQV